MPSGYVKNLAKETGKSEAEIEKLWKKAKGITSETLGTKESDFGSKEYKYTVGIVKNMLGVKEELIDPSKFLNSDLGAKDYLESVVVSSNFSIGNVIPPADKKDRDVLGVQVRDGSGPHGRGVGPGEGKKDGSGLPKDEEEDEEEDDEEEKEERKEDNDNYPVDELDRILDSMM